MKSLRIFGAILGTIGLIGMFSCGGSSFLSETPIELWNADSVVVRFHAVGLDESVTRSNQTGLAKDFFAEDTFSGEGVITGDSLTESIAVDCLFAAPTTSAIDGGTKADFSIVDDVASCADLRNCCVYDIDGGYTDPCMIDVECILDETLPNLANTQIDLGFNLRQHMTTNMRADSGLIITSLVETDQVGVGNSEIFAVDTASTNRAGCTGAASSGTFEVKDDDPWLGIGGLLNGPDVLDVDHLWNVDSVGAVDSGGVGTVSECYLYYENMAGTVPLTPVASSQTVEEFIRMDGIGKICNSLSPTDCDADGTITLEYTLDMYDPAVQSDDLTFAAAGFGPFCATSEINNPCTGSGALNLCLPYVINGRPAAPDGCTPVCMDITGLVDPDITPTSLMAQYADVLSGDTDPTGAICTAANGTLMDIGINFDACLPNQLAACIGGGGGGCNYNQEDLVTVCTGLFEGNPCDEDLAAALSEVFDENTGTDGNGDPIETLDEMYQSCDGAGVWLRAEPANPNDIPAARTDPGFGVCQPIIDRFVDGGQLKNFLVRVVGDDIKIVVGDQLSQDPFSLYDQYVIPNGVASTMFQDGDPNWRYGLSARWSDTPPYTGMKLHTADGLPVDGADGVSAHLDIMRIKESALDQSCTDPDQNYNHDYKLEISLRKPLLGDAETQGSEECGTGPGAMHLFYNLFKVDCVGLGNYDESTNTYIIGTDETVQEARDHIYDTASSLGETPLRTMRDFTDLGQSQCGDDNVGVRFTWMGGTLNQSSPECVAVMDRLFVDYTAPSDQLVLRNGMSYSNDGTYLKFSFGGAPLFKDDVNGFVETDFDGLPSDTSINNGGLLDLYDAAGANPVDTVLYIGRVKLEDTMPTKSDGRGYHYLITMHLVGPDGGGSECNAGGGSLPLYFEIDGDCL